MKKTQTTWGTNIVVNFLTTVGVLALVKIAEVFFSTGHSVLKQASKSLEKKLK